MKLLALLLVAACVSIGVNASCSTTAQWRSKNGRIEYNGEEFAVKGLNWWGMEDPGIGMLTGLDTNSLATYINFMTQNKFNTLRIPISVDWVLHPNRLPNQWTVGAEPSFQGKTGFQVLDLVFAAAEAHGIAIVLDFHWFVEYNSQLGYWYSIGNCVNDKEGDCINFTEEVVNGAWDTVVRRYKSYANFMGIDFFNEAMTATWGLGDPKTDWDLYVTRTTNAILANQPDFQGLFFVEGIADATQPSGCNLQQTYGHWWGGNLEFFKCKPLVVNDQTRIVYFPHTYGPSLYAQTYFSDPSYPANMPAVWDAHFGFLRTTTDQAVLIGEWGGVYTGATKVFQDAFATYLASKKIGNTYWAMIGRPGEINTVDGVITPTNGALNPNAGKLSMLAIAQPRPTIRTFDLTCAPSSTTGFMGTTTGSTPAPATPAPATPAPATPAPSTPAPSTPAPSTPAPSTPAPSTPAPSTPAPSTPAPSTPAPSTGACSLSVTQVKNAGWQQNGKDVTQFEVRVTNNGAKTEQVVVSLASAPISFYSATNPSGTTYGLPNWFANGLPAGSTWVFGYATYGAASTAVSFVTPSSCATGSTPAPSTPAPSTPAPSTPAPSTPAPSTPAPSTPAPSTPAPSVPGGQCSSVTFSQTVSNTWSDAGTVTQYALTVTNAGSKAITALTLSIGSSSSSLVQIWNAEPVAASKSDYTLPAYSYPFGVRASASIGYIVRSTSPITFQVVSMAC